MLLFVCSSFLASKERDELLDRSKPVLVTVACENTGRALIGSFELGDLSTNGLLVDTVLCLRKLPLLAQEDMDAACRMAMTANVEQMLSIHVFRDRWKDAYGGLPEARIDLSGDIVLTAYRLEPADPLPGKVILFQYRASSWNNAMEKLTKMTK